jgi:hypothetical protein
MQCPVGFKIQQRHVIQLNAKRFEPFLGAEEQTASLAKENLIHVAIEKEQALIVVRSSFESHFSL